MADDKEPKPGTYGALTRSTEEEHKRFRAALNKLFFTGEEFVIHGPAIIFIKFGECMKEIKDDTSRKD